MEYVWEDGRCVDGNGGVLGEEKKYTLTHDFNNKEHCLDFCRSYDYTACMWSETGVCDVFTSLEVKGVDGEESHKCYIPGEFEFNYILYHCKYCKY